MSEQSGKDNKWKDYLLKSSLPLEQIVSEKLERQGFIGVGEYSYIRLNEHGARTEFSVDLHAFELIPRAEQDEQFWAILNVLIECKYNYPGVKWVFTPHPSESVIVVGCITALDSLCTERLDDEIPWIEDPLYMLDNQLPYCNRGIEIHGSGADPNTILRGLNQLRYGLPNLVAQECANQIRTSNDEDLQISFICPILVTTANLYRLKTGIDLEAYQSATSLTDIADEVDALIAYQETGPDLYRYCETVAKKLHKQYPQILHRLDEAVALSTPATPAELGGLKVIPVGTTKPAFDSHIVSERNRILVVRLQALEDVLSTVWEAVRKAEKSLKRIAALSKGPDDEVARLVPVARKPSPYRTR